MQAVVHMVAGEVSGIEAQLEILQSAFRSMLLGLAESAGLGMDVIDGIEAAVADASARTGVAVDPALADGIDAAPRAVLAEARLWRSA